MFAGEELVLKMWERGARGNVAFYAAKGGNPIPMAVGDFTDRLGNSAVHYAAQTNNT